MPRGSRLLIVLLTVIPAFPDVVNVTVDGSASGNGSVSVFCYAEDCSSEGYSADLSFAGTNTALGVFNTSGSASLSDPADQFLSLMGQAQQTTAAAAGDLSLDLKDSESSSPITPASSWAMNVENDVWVTFTLTTQSILQLSGDNGFAFGFFSQGSLLDQEGNVILAIPSTSMINLQLTLEPGTYQLSELTEATTGLLVGVSESQDLSLNATFTSITPEPRWTIFGPLLLLALWRCRVRSRGFNNLPRLVWRSTRLPKKTT